MPRLPRKNGRPGSPAADRADTSRAPTLDLAGMPRSDPPELDAYEQAADSNAQFRNPEASYAWTRTNACARCLPPATRRVGRRSRSSPRGHTSRCFLQQLERARFARAEKSCASTNLLKPQLSKGQAPTRERSNSDGQALPSRRAAQHAVSSSSTFFCQPAARIAAPGSRARCRGCSVDLPQHVALRDRRNGRLLAIAIVLVACQRTLPVVDEDYVESDTPPPRAAPATRPPRFTFKAAHPGRAVGMRAIALVGGKEIVSPEFKLILRDGRDAPPVQGDIFRVAGHRAGGCPTSQGQGRQRIGGMNTLFGVGLGRWSS
jgi:hypothetical protein